MSLQLSLPKMAQARVLKENEISIIANGDLRESANQACWAVQEKFEILLRKVLSQKYNKNVVRAHAYLQNKKHGFISSQREGSTVISHIDENASIIVLITAWQYSHHIAYALAQHKGPILLLANFDGTWPGLVGMLNLAGSLKALGCNASRLWSEKFDDTFFYEKLDQWLCSGVINHDMSHIREVYSNTHFFETDAGKIGAKVGNYILRHKEIMGLFDIMCMGMINGLFPQKALSSIGITMEGLSQSALVHEMSLVDDALREQCVQFYEEKGMNFQYGSNPNTELTREQVKDQCAMLIAVARFVERFGLSSVGVQYQQGLKDVCPASDFAEGALGSRERFAITNNDGEIIRKDTPIPCINEVDMGSGIPQTMLFRLLNSLNLPSETTLHDVRWGSVYQGTFYWDFEISGAVPFEHIKGGIKGAIGYRQPAMYFPKGGATIGGQCKAGTFLWARAHYEENTVFMHIGTGEAFELPPEEFKRRSEATTHQWPLMNAVLHGVERDTLMAGHQSNHISIAYVDTQYLVDVTRAFVCQCLTQNMRVFLVGNPVV